ncbi:hypothetical protein ACQEDT_03860 [Agrobacterium pusense]|uniref:hypothetical protein n=1 Tax=Agrobacterium pusense TaxID=648995 RepID=UPI003D0E1DCC
MQSEKQIAAAQGVLGRGGVYVGAELVKAALEAALSAAEPVAARHSFDGNGFQYIDDGSGSDWKTRKPDAELLYTAPPVPSVAVKALDARSLAIDIVDGVKGYTLEFAQDQQAHKIDWDIAEGKINDALSAQVQDVAGWQPIETAPKDGTQFLAFDKGSYLNCWWHDNGYGEQYWMDDADSEPNPSHWMPLPAAPAKQEGGDVTSK